jgi:hypothetical protein
LRRGNQSIERKKKKKEKKKKKQKKKVKEVSSVPTLSESTAVLCCALQCAQ